jgi:S-adenosylmethionine:tRNA ribosyltransferase-isomerase
VRTSELDYELPERLIAQYPPAERDGGRLLELDGEAIRHRRVSDFGDLVPSGALLVVNDTRVQAARLLGTRVDTLGKVELLVLEAHGTGGAYLAIGKAKRPLLPGDRVRVGDLELGIEDRLPEGGALVLRSDVPMEQVLQRHGHVPLPPYVRRPDEASDRDRYQTVFARLPGSAAAPTAGLHLTRATLGRLRARGVEIARVTLHVGLGTFRPVSVDDLSEHTMHEEHCVVSAEVVDAVRRARARGAQVIAVGTTVVRTLESAAQSGQLTPFSGRTRLFISPGFRFSVVEGLLTNFHAPRSTLLALIFAFAGSEAVRAAYRAAIEQEYRFLSYGDAMWIPKRLA